MSYVVCYVKKFKADGLEGLSGHNNRVSDKHSNLDIDPELKPNNFSALTGIAGNPVTDYKNRVDEVIKRCYTVNQKIRKDAVLLCGVVVSSGVEFFRELEDNEIKRFFKVAAEFLQSYYGAENMVDDKVHMDETTPHLHYEFVPIIEGHLCAKRLFTKRSLTKLQDDIAKALQGAGFNIKRGVQASGVRHKDIPILKKETFRLMGDYESQQEMLKALKDEANALHKMLLASGNEHEYRHFFVSLDAFIKVYDKLLFENASLIRKNRSIEEARKNLQSQNVRFKRRLGIISDDVFSLEN